MFNFNCRLILCHFFWGMYLYVCGMKCELVEDGGVFG